MWPSPGRCGKQLDKNELSNREGSETNGFFLEFSTGKETKTRPKKWGWFDKKLDFSAIFCFTLVFSPCFVSQFSPEPAGFGPQRVGWFDHLEPC